MNILLPLSQTPFKHFSGKFCSQFCLYDNDFTCNLLITFHIFDRIVVAAHLFFNQIINFIDIVLIFFTHLLM